MAGGDKPLEYFVLITMLAKGDALNTWSPQLVQLLGSSNTLPPFWRNPVPPFLKAQVISNAISCFYVLDGGGDLGRLHVCIKHQINF